MSKQDRTHSRTPADTENKFLLNLGKRFSEVLGVATDARKAAENTENQLQLSVAEITKELGKNKATIKLVVDSGLVDEDGKVQASIIIEAINKESTAKILADNIIFEGQKLNIKVESSNIEGKLTADQINADNLKVKAANITDKLTADQIDATNLKVKAANIEDKLTADQINADGIKAENVDISGKVTAQDGEIGDWILGEAEIPYLYADGTEAYYDSQAALYSGEQRYELDADQYNIVETWLTSRGVYSRIKHYNDEGVNTLTQYYSDRWCDLLKKSQEVTPTESWTFTLEDGSTVNKSVCIK